MNWYEKYNGWCTHWADRGCNWLADKSFAADKWWDKNHPAFIMSFFIFAVIFCVIAVIYK